MFFISMSSYCHSTTEWLDSNDVCMSGGSWACCGGTTKERGHCGYSKWGNSSHHLTVGSPPFSVRNCYCFCSQSKDTTVWQYHHDSFLCFSILVGLFCIENLAWVHFTIEALVCTTWECMCHSNTTSRAQYNGNTSSLTRHAWLFG